MQFLPVPICAASPHGTAILGRSGLAVIPNSHSRHQTGPRKPKLVKVIEGEEVKRKTGYSRAHTSHCGPDGIYMNALGSVDGKGPGGIFVIDPETLKSRVHGRWIAVRNTWRTTSGGIWVTTR